MSVSADYVLKQPYYENSCTGSIVPYREVLYGDIGVNGGCYQDTATIYKKWRCVTNKTAVLDSYTSNTCSGTAINTEPQSISPNVFGCSSSGTLTTCVKGKYVPWTNTYQKKVNNRLFTCSDAELESPTSIYEHRLDRCRSFVSGTSNKITYDSVTQNITKLTYSVKSCVGTPTITFVGVLGCNDTETIDPITFTVSAVSPSPSPVPVGASPSSTPTFVASPIPFPSSEYEEIPGCSYIADVTGSDSFTNYVCYMKEDSKKSKAMYSILVYNKLEGNIIVTQKGLQNKDDTSQATLATAMDISASETNSIASNDIWVSLSKVPCANIENPSGHCILSFKGTENYKIWITMYSLKTTSSGNASLIGGVLAGICFVVLVVLIVLHTLRIVTIPCFNCCCDNRVKNKRHLTMTPEGAVSYPVVLPTQYQQPQQRSHVVSNMQAGHTGYV
jgi:hypothetical protein